MADLMTNRSGFRRLLLMNLVLGVFFALHLFYIPPHFDDLFCMWKAIMGESGGYLKDYNYANDIVLLQYGFQHLYSWSPHVSWLPLFFIATSLCSFLLIVNALFLYLHKQKHHIAFFICACIVLLGMYQPNLMWVHHNRTAFLICSSALTGLFLYTLYHPRGSEKKRYRILLWLWFGLGLLTRPEAAIASMMLFMPFWVWIMRKQLRPAFIVVLPPLLFVLIFVGYYWWQTHSSEAFYYQLEPNVEYALMDRQEAIPLSEMKTREDSARYIAARRWMLGDTRQTTPSFLRRLIASDDSPEKGFLFFFQPGSQLAPAELAKVLYQRLAAQPAVLFILFMLLLWPWSSNRLTHHAAVLSLFAYSLFLLTLSMFVREYPRVTQPFLFCVTVAFIIYFFSSIDQLPKIFTIRRAAFSIVFLFILAFIIPQSQTLYQESAKKRADQQSLRQKINQLLHDNPNRKFVAVMGNWDVFDTGVFDPFTGFGEKTLLLTEIGQYSANNAFLETTRTRTGCAGRDFLCRIAFLEKHRQDIIFIATPARVDLYHTYMEMLYQYNFDIRSASRILLTRDTYAWLP